MSSFTKAKKSFQKNHKERGQVCAAYIYGNVDQVDNKIPFLLPVEESQAPWPSGETQRLCASSKVCIHL